MSAVDFRLHADPTQIAPKVFVGRGTVADDTPRVYLHANNAELTPAQVLVLIASLADLARQGGWS